MNSIPKFSAVLVIIVIWTVSAVVFAQFPDHWTKDPANPISTDFGGSAVIFHDGVYKCWGDAASGIHYGTSPDGRNWTLHPASPVLLEGPEWYDINATDNPSVVVVDGVFHMFYSCIAADDNNRIAHATSPDGITWTKDPANPVLDLGPPGSVDSGELIHPFVLYEEPQFRIWYNSHTDEPGDTPQNIAHATSFDGVTWARYPSPVLEPGAPEEWDGSGLFIMSVARYQDIYYMFYTGGLGDVDGGTAVMQIGYATSSNGVDWTKRDPSEPVLTIGEEGSWESLLVGGPAILATEYGFVMWYFGSTDWENFSWGMAYSVIDPSNWLEIIFDKNDGIPDKHSVRMGVNKVGAASGSLATPFGIYAMTPWEGYWTPEQSFYLDHSNLSYMELINVASTWTLVWDPGSPTTETVCTIDFGPLQGGEFPRMPVVSMPPDDLTIIDPDPNPPTIAWNFGSVDPCIAVTDYVAVNLYGPDSQEIDSGELPCTSLSWTPPDPLAPGDWTVEVSNDVSGVRDVPDGLTMTGDAWPLSNSDWLAVRTLGIPFNHISGTPPHPASDAAIRLIGNIPNPFNPQTTIAFDMPMQEAVRLAVYDVSGRLVDVLIDKEIAAQGRNEVVWRGRDSGGRVAPAGVYFYRLEAGEYSETRRMTLIK